MELEIIDFIEEVVLKENDYMKEERMQFFEEEVRGFWPHIYRKNCRRYKIFFLGKLW